MAAITARQVDNIVNEIGAGVAKITKSETEWKEALNAVIEGLKEAVAAL